jgi:hypothetical protein
MAPRLETIAANTSPGFALFRSQSSTGLTSEHLNVSLSIAGKMSAKPFGTDMWPASHVVAVPSSFACAESCTSAAHVAAMPARRAAQTGFTRIAKVYHRDPLP